MSVLDSFRLDGKVAVVTGGARHLGYDMACALAEAGCDLVITSRTQKAAKKTAKDLETQYKVNVLPLSLDVRKPAQVARMARRALDWQGHIDILINNAGGGSGNRPAHLFERSTADMDNLIATNLNGALYCCHQIAPIMAKQKHGKIINIASIAGMVGRDRRMYSRNGMLGQPIEYAAAKAGVIGMTLDLAGLLGPMGICVNSISPGGFERGQPKGFIKDYKNATALGRMGRDGVDLKGAALFLASAASDYVTGHNLVMDGGFAIWK